MIFNSIDAASYQILDFTCLKSHHNWIVAIDIGFSVRNWIELTTFQWWQTKIAELLSTMSRATGKEFYNNGSFHQAFSSVLVFAQCLAILPVIGIKSSSSYGLRFTWKSFRTIYSVTAFCFAASYTVFATFITLRKKITFNSIGLYRKRIIPCDTLYWIVYFQHSSVGILLNNCIWCVEFHRCGEKMAQTDATLGDSWSHFTTLQNKRGKATTHASDSNDVVYHFVRCIRYDWFHCTTK